MQYITGMIGGVYLNGQTEQCIPHRLQSFCFCLKIMYCVVLCSKAFLKDKNLHKQCKFEHTCKYTCSVLVVHVIMNVQQYTCLN